MTPSRTSKAATVPASQGCNESGWRGVPTTKRPPDRGVPAGAVGPSGRTGSLAWNATVWERMLGKAAISPAPAAPRSA